MAKISNWSNKAVARALRKVDLGPAMVPRPPLTPLTPPPMPKKGLTVADAAAKERFGGLEISSMVEDEFIDDGPTTISQQEIQNVAKAMKEIDTARLRTKLIKGIETHYGGHFPPMEWGATDTVGLLIRILSHVEFPLRPDGAFESYREVAEGLDPEMVQSIHTFLKGWAEAKSVPPSSENEAWGSWA